MWLGLWMGACMERSVPLDTAPVAAPPAEAPAPWNDDAFWDTPGPFANLVRPRGDEETSWTVGVATRAPGGTWEALPHAVLRNLNSLDVLETQRGLILVGLLDGYGLYDSSIPSVAVFATTDLEHWSSHRWTVLDARGRSIVDPALHRRPDGTFELVYYGASVRGVDPVEIPGPHAIRRATWDEGDGAWREEPEDIAAFDGAVDPMLCNLRDEEWLFATQSAERVVAGKLGPDGRLVGIPTAFWEGHTVPFCRPRDAGLEVFAHAEQAAPVPPSVAHFDGTTFQERGEAYSGLSRMWNHCTSPVVATLQERDVLFCAFRLSDLPR